MRLSPNRKLLSYSLLILVAGQSVVILSSCGSENVFRNAVKRSDSDKAKAALEAGDVETAIESLNDYLKDHPDDMTARSMLANAYLKKSGVDLLKIGTSMSSGGNGQSSWSTVSGALPDGSEQNVTNMKAAVSALESIPVAQRTDEQNYQLAVAQTTLAVTVAKKAAGDTSSGQISAEKVDQMSDSDALTIYNALQGSKSASNAMSTPNSGLSSVGSIATSVDQQAGSTPEERLRNYLKSQH
ncbi:tetratricopeptide repeat protein [bacterium]|nr:tetratricopeptide repeat protein [bacterium]